MIRLISGYQCQKDDSKGASSVRAQQQGFYEEKGLDKDPWVTFQEDMIVLIKSCQDKGDMIILFLDANEDLTEVGGFHTAMEALGLYNPIFDNHKPPYPTSGDPERLTVCMFPKSLPLCIVGCSHGKLTQKARTIDACGSNLTLENSLGTDPRNTLSQRHAVCS